MKNDKILKALNLCTKKPTSSREVLKKIYVEPTDGGFSLTATDGELLLKAEYPLNEWRDLVDVVWEGYGFEMPKELARGLLCLDSKKRKKGKIFEIIGEEAYPDYRRAIAVDVSENPKPFFMGFEVMARIKKIYTLIEHKIDHGWYPDIYGSTAFSPTIKKIDNFTIVAMPSRHPHEESF